MDKEIIKRDAQDEALFLYESRIKQWYKNEKEQNIYVESFANELLRLIGKEQ